MKRPYHWRLPIECYLSQLGPCATKMVHTRARYQTSNSCHSFQRVNPTQYHTILWCERLHSDPSNQNSQYSKRPTSCCIRTLSTDILVLVLFVKWDYCPVFHQLHGLVSLIVSSLKQQSRKEFFVLRRQPIYQKMISLLFIHSKAVNISSNKYTPTTKEQIKLSMPSTSLQPPSRSREAVSPPPHVEAKNEHLDVTKPKLPHRFGQEILDKLCPVPLGASQVDESKLRKRLKKERK